jgi:hypothetical protein
VELGLKLPSPVHRLDSVAIGTAVPIPVFTL